MCGIFGYIGNAESIWAESIILTGLAKLEYRGYDSAGMVVFSSLTGCDQFKAIGHIQSLTSLVNESKDPLKKYRSWIGHTRWATHGRVTLENTHPHTDAKKEYFVVHNGIIENHAKLRATLKKQTFYGETDTEVVAKLLAETPGETLIARVQTIVPKLHGSFALVIMAAQDPSEMIGIKKWGPLILGRSKNGTFYLVSDANAISGLVESVVYLEDGDIVHIQNGKYTIESLGDPIVRPLIKLAHHANSSEKWKFEHFMLKEIYEAPEVLTNVFQGRVNFIDGTIAADAFLDIRELPFERVEFIACGTSYHAGLLGSYWIEELSDLDTGVTIASEFFSRTPRVSSTTLFVFISQSWETADAIEPLKWLRDQGAHTFGVVNTVGSTIARLTESGIFTRAGIEVGVASTKAYIGQIWALLIMSLFFSIQSWADYKVYREILAGIEELSLLADSVLESTHDIKKVAHALAGFEHMFFLGRGPSYAIALEAALKFKEITYIHAHASPLGELKHGPLALIDPRCPCVVFLPDGAGFEQGLVSISEIQARSGRVCVVSQSPVPGADWNIILPKCHPVFFGFLAAIAGQLLAYHAAHILGREIDKPRNLAKSVTVR